jgi:hemerythrin-like domain-containing protein
MAKPGWGRREFLASASAAVLAARAGAAEKEPAGNAEKEEEEVAPGEDLMREHGVLRRVMLVYDEGVHRLDAHQELPLDAVSAAAGIVRRVIEDYHEKLEERFLFPRFERRGELTDLVAVLRDQHRAGREVTAAIQELAKAPVRTDSGRRQLAGRLRAFTRMYRPHAAREDTVLFPAFHGLVGQRAYMELGEQFEDQERRVLGESGFEGAVKEVAKLEEELGIHDLARFTP